MTFRMVHRTDLPASQSPFRIVDDSGRKVGVGPTSISMCIACKDWRS